MSKRCSNPAGCNNNCQFGFCAYASFSAEGSGSIPVSPQDKAHTPAPKLEDWHGVIRLLTHLSQLQAGQDNLRAELDQVEHKLPLPPELQPVSLLPLAERNRKGIRKAIDSLMKRT